MSPRARLVLPLGVLSLLIGGVLVHLASSQPDGLETVADRQGFADRERPTTAAVFPDRSSPS